MAKTMLGSHFLAADRRLQHGAREVVEVGRTYRAEGPLVMCRNGMHASKRALDALKYAPGPVVCRVQLGGEALHDSDKAGAAAGAAARGAAGDAQNLILELLLESLR